jgi:hypothetical protein
MNLPNCSHDDATVPILVSIVMDDDSSVSSSSLSYNSVGSYCHTKTSSTTTGKSHHCPVVRFSTVTIIEFPPILGGDTVPSSGGPPVALGLTPCRTMIHDVEHLELGRSTSPSTTTTTTTITSKNNPWCYPPRRSSKELLLSGETRTEMLVDAGYSLTYLSRDTVEGFYIQQKRMEATQMLFAEWEAEQQRQRQQQEISETSSSSISIQEGHQQQEEHRKNLKQIQHQMKKKDAITVWGGPKKSHQQQEQQQQHQQERTSLISKVVLSARFLAWATRKRNF